MTSQALQVKLSEMFGPAFYPVHNDMKADLYESYWLEGGRGSLKSSFAALKIMLGIMQDPAANGVALRKVGNTLRDSILATFSWAADMLNVAHLWKITTAPPEITYLPTGQKIICRGLDDPLKLKSIKARKGYFKFLWFEEAQELSGMAEIRSVRQSVLRGGKNFCEFVTYNPPQEEFHWINKEAEATIKRRRVHHSTYLEVDPNWLGQKFLDDAEDLKQRDLLAYQHEYLGMKVGNGEEVIFAGKVRAEGFEIKPGWDGPYYGVDFGFSQDALATVEMYIETLPPVGKAAPRKKLYVSQSEAEIGVELDMHANFLDRFGSIRKHPLMCDSARPDIIAYLRRQGFDARAVEKGEGSVEQGIVFLKNFTGIVLHQDHAKTFIKEVPKYKYKRDPNTGEITRKPIDKDNHHFDAARYAIEKMIKHRKGFFN